MTPDVRKSHDSVWLEPVAASVLFALALYLNWDDPWPWKWVIDLVMCSGAAMSRRWPLMGATLTAVGLAVWLPFPGAVASASGMAFYINIFAAVRTNLSWKIPMTVGLGALAYLTLVRNSIELVSFRWTTSILLIIVLAVVWAGGSALRYAATRLESERETGQQRIEELQRDLARELHDSVAQTLSSAAMRANIALSDPGLSPLSREQMERIAEECRSSAHDLRQLLSSLRETHERAVAPGPLADVESLRNAVEAQAERLRSEGFTVEVDIRLARLSAARCQTLAAIAVEAANNMVKHAKASSRCTMSMVTGEDGVVAEFSNVMKKSARASQQGFGLTGIQERLTMLDGTCAVTRKQGQWMLQAWLPLGMEGSSSSPTSASSPTVQTPPAPPDDLVAQTAFQRQTAY